MNPVAPAARPPRVHPAAVPLLLAAAALLGGCTREPRSPLQLPAASTPELAVDPAQRIVTATSTLRREAAEPARAKGEPARGGASAALATLSRGDRVTLVETRDDQARVRTADGTEGWLRAAALLPAREAVEGTVLENALVFDRPDLLAENARRRLEPGTLLVVRKTKDLFTEVEAGPGASAWVLTDRVTTQPADVAAARMVEKARFLLRSDRRGEALDLLARLRTEQPGSPLVPVLAVDLGDLPPEPAPSPTGPPGAGPSTAPSGPPGTP